MALQTTTTVSLDITQRMLLGVLLAYGAGLANSAVLHDTAHDSRHACGFPCH